MPRGYRKFSPEFREEVTKLAIDSPKTIAEIAREYNMHETTLENWVRAYKEKHGEAEEPLTLPERARLRELERKNRGSGRCLSRASSRVALVLVQCGADLHRVARV